MTEPPSLNCTVPVGGPPNVAVTVALKVTDWWNEDGLTDDATVVDDLCRVQLVEGDYRNLKITTPEDLLVAEALLGAAT